MPEFNITAPDGRKFKVTAPEGASQADVLARVQQQYATPAEPTPPKTTEEPSSWMDFLKSIPRGLAEGAAQIPSAKRPNVGFAGGFPGQMNRPGTPVEETVGKIEQLTGPLHRPETTTGKYGAAIGRALGDPLTYAGPGAVARKVASGIGGAAGGELGGQVSGDSVWGRLAGGLVGGLAGGVRRAAPERPPPAIQEIRDAGTQAYEAAKALRIPVPAQEASNIVGSIMDRLNLAGMYRENYGKVFRELESVHHQVVPPKINYMAPLTGPRATAPPPRFISSTELFSIEKELSEIQRLDSSARVREAARMARRDITGYLRQNYPQFAEYMRAGDANWRAASMARDVAQAAERGEMAAAASGRGANIDNALRQRIRALYDNQKIPKTQEELRLMRDIIGADNSPVSTRQLARTFSRTSGPARFLGRGALAAIAAGHSPHLLVGAIQMLAEGVANRATRGRVQNLEELVRRTAPAAGPRNIPPRTVPGQRAAGAARGAYEGTKDEKTRKPLQITVHPDPSRYGGVE